MGNKIFIVFLVVMVSLPNFTVASDKPKQIDQLIRRYHDLNQFTGTILVSENGKVIFKGAYGYANREWKIANTTDTKMKVGSLTKQFTAMLVMQMMEKGKLSLDGSISDYLPEYRKDTGAKVTIEHLLTNTSGIPEFTGFPEFSKQVKRNPSSVSELVKNYCSQDLEFEPGSKYAYSNSGYIILGAILERVAGVSYQELLSKNIFKPLKMKSSGYVQNDIILSKGASGYILHFGEYANAGYIDMSVPFSAGGMHSTIEDMYLWDQALYTNKLLSKSGIKRMFVPSLNGYGYGWGIAELDVEGLDRKLKASLHEGSIDGFRSVIIRLMDDKHMIVVLSNQNPAPLKEMTDKMIRILYEKPFALPKPSVESIFYRAYKNVGIDKAIKDLDRLLRDQHQSIKSSDELNFIAYSFLWNNQPQFAIKILKENIRRFPKEANPYDSLADVYMHLCQDELAKENLQAALKIDPGFKYALDHMQQLNDQKRKCRAE